MALVRWVTEMGMGVDVHGGDYTKAAERAISDAIRHSSLNFFAAAGKERDEMQIEAVIAVAEPDALDHDRIKAALPYGTVTVTAKAGGLNVPAPNGNDLMVIANAAILVSFPE
ncbi:MAG: Lin0512 family protein [Acidimicrobiales bacterium]